MAGKNIAHLGQGEEVGKDTSFQARLEKGSCTAVLEARRWRFRRDLSRGVGRNISGIRGDKQHRGTERTVGWRGGKGVLE